MPKRLNAHAGTAGRAVSTRPAGGARGPSTRRPPAAAEDLQRANRELRHELHGLRERQESLEQARAEYVDLFDFAPVTYALLDTIGVVVQVNMAGCRLLNTERTHVVGHPLLVFVAEEDRRELLAHLRRCRSAGTVVETELRLAPRGTGWVTCRLYSMRASSGDREVFPTVIVDQTERLSLDEARLRAEHGREQAARGADVAREVSAAKDRLLATISHELRTPLTPALLAASRLASWDELPDPARMLAAAVKRNIELEARLIDDLLDLAGITRQRVALVLAPVDVTEALTEAIRICQPAAGAKGITISTRLLAPVPYVHGDRIRLEQVFWNLLDNAIKFTDPGGAIVVHTATPSDGVVRVTVRDNGVGMVATVLGQLFAPFDRGHAQVESRAGLGLGLAICKGIIAAHGGQIWASSAGPGQGATFAVELSTMPAPATPTPLARLAAVPAVAPNEAATRVLVIEDDADSREMLSLFLAHYGFRVETASSLHAGIERLDEPWHAVLSDIGLPDGSGLEVARSARRRAHQPDRLIAFTGYGSDDDVRASREAGFDDHVVKPIDLERLLTVLQQSPAPPAQP